MKYYYILLAIVVIVALVAYMSNSTNDAVDPRTNLSNVLKANTKFESFAVTPKPNDITQSVMRGWKTLTELIKTITGKEPSICMKWPAVIDTTNDNSMNIFSTNMKYVCKKALRAAAENNNFYDIAALFLQIIKVQTGDLPFLVTVTYDSNGLLTKVAVETQKDGSWTIGFFKSMLSKPPLTMPGPNFFGNDEDIITFANLSVGFYNSYVSTLSTMPQDQNTFDALTFGKLIACMFISQMFESPTKPFICNA